MNRWTLCALFMCGIACAAASGATNVIVQYNGNLHEGTNYSINPDLMRATIILGVEGETFEFEALLVDDPNDPLGTYYQPGDIDRIMAVENAGPVTLTVVEHNGHPHGAQNVGQIDLSAAGVTGTIAALNISGDLNAVGPTTAANAGDLAIGGTVLDAVEINTGAGGTVSIGTLAALLKCRGLAGLTVNATTPQAAVEYEFSPGPTPGEIWVGGALDHLRLFDDVVAPVTVLGSIGRLLTNRIAPPSGTRFDVGDVGSGSVGDIAGEMKTGDLVGVFEVYYDLTGSLWVSDRVQRGLTVWGALTGSLEASIAPGASIVLDQASSGTVRIVEMQSGVFRTVHGDFSGQVFVDGALSAATFWIGFRPNGTPTYANLTGRIQIGWSDSSAIFLYVSGALDDPYDPNVPGSQPLSGGYVTLPSYCGGAIDVQGGMAGTTEFVAVNYDGGTPYDSWCPGAPIALAGTSYFGNTAEFNLWESAPCRGDMNNDSVIDFDDISPFVLALSNAQGYSLAFPGLGGTAADDYLGGSRPWHGDVNCSGTFGFDDINAFVALMSNPTCLPECAGDGGENGMRAGTENDVDGLSPEQVAAMLGGNVDPGLYDSLVTLVGENVAQQETDEDTAYWEAVYYALIE